MKKKKKVLENLASELNQVLVRDCVGHAIKDKDARNVVQCFNYGKVGHYRKGGKEKSKVGEESTETRVASHSVQQPT